MDEAPYQVVITDRNLPESDGLETAGEIRGISKGGSALILLMVSDLSRDDYIDSYY